MKMKHKIELLIKEVLLIIEWVLRKAYLKIEMSICMVERHKRWPWMVQIENLLESSMHME